MNGILSQMITLVTYGNDYLKGGQLPKAFYPSHDTFKFCNNVAFLEIKDGDSPAFPQNDVIAPGPMAWFDYLKNKDCESLRLYFRYSGNESFPDYQSAGMVGGGGQWWIEANYRQSCDVWASRWTVTDKDNPDKKIWQVSYGLLATTQPPTEMPCDLEIIKKTTGDRLSSIIAFTKEQKLDNWQTIFQNALAKLNSQEPADSKYTRSMIPQQNYSLIARQLLFTAVEMNVFGGMGSWNDLGFDEKAINEQYKKLSYNLYDNVCVNILSSVNSY